MSENVNRETGEVTALARQSQAMAVRPELDVAAVRAQVAAIQDLMKSVLKEGTHYGVIPGCDKPSLLQAGAEKIGLMFRLVPRYTLNVAWDDEVKRRWERADKSGKVYKSGETKGRVRAEVICTLIHATSGGEMGSGIGVCNSWEKKYEMVDPYNIEETIVQMARKRALVNAIRTATAASDIFTQDVEDITPMADGAPAAAPRATRPAPAAKAPAPAPNAAQGDVVRLSTTDPPCPVCGKTGMTDWTESHARKKAEGKASSAWKCADSNYDKEKKKELGCPGSWWCTDPNDDTKTIDKYGLREKYHLGEAVQAAPKAAPATQPAEPEPQSESGPPYPDVPSAWDAFYDVLVDKTDDERNAAWNRIVKDVMQTPTANASKATPEQLARIVEMAQSEATDSPLDELAQEAEKRV